MRVLKIYLDYKRICNYFLIFLIAQLSLWYGGLADIIPGFLLSNWNLLCIGSFAAMLLFVLVKKRKLSVFTMLMLIMQGYICLVTYVNGQNISVSTLLSVAKYMCLPLLFEIWQNKKEYILKVYMFIFEVMIFYNIYTCIIIGPDRYGSYYGALGYDNGFAAYFVTAYFLSVAYCLVFKKKLRPLLLLMATHFNAFYVWTGSSMIAILIADVLMAVVYFRKIEVNIRTVYIISLIVTLLVVFFQFQKLFAFVIVDLLGKDLSLTGRTEIWSNALEAICRKPLFGYGNMSQAQEAKVFGDVYCHNGFLELLFRGGVLYLLIFSGLFHLISRKQITLTIECKAIAAIACVPIFIIAIAESVFINYVVFIPLFFSYYLSDMIDWPT